MAPETNEAVETNEAAQVCLEVLQEYASALNGLYMCCESESNLTWRGIDPPQMNVKISEVTLSTDSHLYRHGSVGILMIKLATPMAMEHMPWETWKWLRVALSLDADDVLTSDLMPRHAAKHPQILSLLVVSDVPMMGSATSQQHSLQTILKVWQTQITGRTFKLVALSMGDVAFA